MTADAAALARTHAAANERDRAWKAAEFQGLLAGPGVWLIGDSACFVLARVILDEAEVLTIATHPDQQRRGLARTALARCVQEAAARGALRVFLEVATDNAAGIALYSGAGFARIGLRRGYFARPGGAVDALIMERRI